jgi:DNA primase
MSDKLPETFVKEVVEHTSLVDLVGQHVKLKKSGGSFLGLCPFHGEKSPSFTVSEDKHFFHCFGCGKHGDAIEFLTSYAGLTFREAVTELAERLGRPLPTSTPGGPPQPSLAPLYAAQEMAYKFFRHCLKYTDKPKAYLKGRGVNAETLKRFAIAYAPEGWQSLEEAFPDYKTNPVLVQAGLVKEKDGRRYDAFRDRLIFAIRDTRGRILGFGGRAFNDDAKPKYLNSPETPIFDKGDILFGVYEARAAIQARKQAIVVEGYMDVVMIAQYGVENAVASMGTACTDKQIQRLTSLAPETVFCFDGDSAGQKAAWRAMENCIPHATDSHIFRFCLLDGDMDPDEIIQKEGKAAFEKRIGEALPLSSFLISQLAARHNDLQSPEDRARFLTEGMDLLKRLPYGSRLYRVMRDELSKAANVGVSEVMAMIKRPTFRTATKEEAFWSHLTNAVMTWPAVAATKVEDLVNSLPEAEYAEIESESFSCDAERHFWETFLSIPEMADEAKVEPSNPSADQIALRDLVHNLATTITRNLERTRQARLSAQYRAGKISEDEFIAMRQKA